MILVTGGTGFVGPEIVRALRAEERPVRLLVRRPGRAQALAALGCELVQGDVTDAASLRRAVAGCDTVVDLIAILAGSREAFRRVMIQGTRDLVAAAREEGVGRFVLMSALGTSEETKDLTAYYHAKWEKEQAVRDSGLAYTIFRPSFIFGPGGGVLQGVLRAARFSPVIPVVGSRRLQPIWIEDVAAFFARSLATEAARNRTFELGGPDAVTWDELYATVLAVSGRRRARVHVPIGLARAAAAVVEKLPLDVPLSREALTMLEYADNVTDIAPAVEVFGIEPIGLEEQIRRATG